MTLPDEAMRKMNLEWIIQWTFKHDVALSGEARDELLAALASSERKDAERASWQWVPKEPTEVMLIAAKVARDQMLFNSNRSMNEQFIFVYRAMLAAAMKGPTEGQRQAAIEAYILTDKLLAAASRVKTQDA